MDFIRRGKTALPIFKPCPHLRLALFWYYRHLRTTFEGERAYMRKIAQSGRDLPKGFSGGKRFSRADYIAWRIFPYGQGSRTYL